MLGEEGWGLDFPRISIIYQCFGFMIVQKFTMVITSCVQMFDRLGYKSSSHCQVSHSCIQSLKSDILSIGLWFLVL